MVIITPPLTFGFEIGASIIKFFLFSIIMAKLPSLTATMFWFISKINLSARGGVVKCFS
jgi:hypothetical protein